MIILGCVVVACLALWASLDAPPTTEATVDTEADADGALLRKELESPAVFKPMYSAPTSAPSPPEKVKPTEAAEPATSRILNRALATAVQRADARQSFAFSVTQGGAFGRFPFQEHCPDGILIGLRIGLGKFFADDTIKSIQPIYSTPAGERLGQFHGINVDRNYVMKGPPGYAVGSVALRGGGGLDAITITFMRIRGESLDPTDCYATPRLGGPGGSEALLGGDGTPVVGIHGHANEKNEWLGLGLVFLHPTPTAAPH